MTPEQALAYIEQERLDVLSEGHTEEECNRIAAYVLASAYRKLLVRTEVVAPVDRAWMSKNVDPFASFFLQQYEKTGSLRESMMFAFVKTFDGVDPCVRCYNCGSMNRLNGQLVHQSNCFVGRDRRGEPQHDEGDK